MYSRCTRQHNPYVHIIEDTCFGNLTLSEFTYYPELAIIAAYEQRQLNVAFNLARYYRQCPARLNADQSF